MHLRRAAALILFLCLTSLIFSSCVVRRRLIVRGNGKKTPTLLVADKATLLAEITREYDAIHDLNATVDMVPALGSVEKNKITEYKDVRAYILYQKPDFIRLIGLYPVVRNKAFDMVSNGTDFRLYVPSKNRFLVGKNEIIAPSKNKLENLRPQHFLDALIVHPVEHPQDVLLENFTDEENAIYILHIVSRNGKTGDLQLSRTIWFSREDLRMSRQIIFDDNGNILTDARYTDWQVYDGVPFPKHIDINRPRDEYAVVITVVKMDINKGVTEDKFTLEQPEGTTLQVVGQPPATPPASPKPAPPPRKKTKK